MRCSFSGLLLAAALLLPASLEAQVRTLAPGSFSVGARVGYDFDSNNGALVLGGATRVSIPGAKRFEIQTVADFTFLRDLTERQFSAELLYQLGGFAVGGGVALRNTLWLEDLTQRETRTGYTIVGIFGGQATRSLLSSQLELRYSSVSTFSPSSISLGVSIPLLKY